MKLWSSFYDLVAPDVPGCPFEAVDAALRQSTVAFCEESLAWKHGHPTVWVVPGVAEYLFAPPAEAVVHAITHAEFNGREIDSHASQLDQTIDNWRNKTGTPRYALGGPGALTLVPVPDVEGALALTVALKPSPSAIGAGDVLFDEYRGVIAHGTLARLMLSPKKPYSNPSLAQYHHQQAVIKTAAAGTRTARNYTRAPLRIGIRKRGK